MNREPPSSPPVAYFLRRYSFLWEAFRALEADESVKTHRDIIRLIKAARLALGKDFQNNYMASRHVLEKWLRQAEEDDGAGSGMARSLVEGIALPLVASYADPARFFREVAPTVEPNRLFDADVLFSSTGVNGPQLGRVLQTWGYGALLNSTVRDAMDKAGPRELRRALAEAEGRMTYKEGRKPTVDKDSVAISTTRSPTC